MRPRRSMRPPDQIPGQIDPLARAFNAMVADLRLESQIEDTFGRYVDPCLSRPAASGG